MIKTKRSILFGVYFVCLAALCTADPISQIIQQHKQGKTVFAILAVDAQSGKTLYQNNAETPMIPASNMKVVTAAAALHYLGADYVFQTKAGLLGDNLVIIGSGDPLLADPKIDSQDPRSPNRIFDEIVSSLKVAGIASVQDVIVDVSFFDNNRVHPSWPKEQLNQWYACEVSGLNFYNNCIRITAERTNNTAILRMEPPNSYITLINQLKLVSKGSSAIGAYRNSVPNKLLVKGNLNQQAGFDVAIENPQGLMASVLSDHLIQAGISVKGKLIQKYVKNDDSIRIVKVFQTPLQEVLMRSNKDSLGLAAESLVKTISAENTRGRINGEWAHGLSLISRYLQSLGIPPEQFTLDDGSGLSRKNRLSPNVLVKVYRDIYSAGDSGFFFDSLAVGGVDGTISKYFREQPYQNNIYGKTGYIANVRTFSGICKTPRGDILFSILTEGGSSATRQCINAITAAIYDGAY